MAHYLIIIKTLIDRVRAIIRIRPMHDYKSNQIK